MIVCTYPATKSRETYKKYTPPALPPPKQTQTTFPSSSPSRPNEIDRNRAKQFEIPPEEFVRRDNIVRQLFLDTAMFYKPNDTVQCKNDSDKTVYGRLHIRGVFKTYHDFPTAEAQAWPKDDIPYIFTVQPEITTNGQVVLCTADFFEPVKK